MQARHLPATFLSSLEEDDDEVRPLTLMEQRLSKRPGSKSAFSIWFHPKQGNSAYEEKVSKQTSNSSDPLRILPLL